MGVQNITDQALAISRRPDQRDNVETWVNEVVKYIFRNNRWPQDFYEIAFEPTGELIESPTKITLPYTNEFEEEQFNLIGYSISLIDYVMTDASKGGLTEVSPGDALRSGCPLLDVYYRVGADRLVINAAIPFRVLRLGAYLSPPWFSSSGNDGDTYWLFREAEDLIIKGVIAKIFRNVGDDDSYRIFQTEFLQGVEAFKLNKTPMGI